MYKTHYLLYKICKKWDKRTKIKCGYALAHYFKRRSKRKIIQEYLVDIVSSANL